MEAGAAFAAVMAASLANGGSFDDIMSGIQYFKDLKDSGNFIPVQVNEATVLASDRVDVAGVTIPTPTANGFAPGTKVTLLVRPDDVSIAPVGAPSDDIVGSVVTRTFAGPSTIIYVRLDKLDALIGAHLASARVNGLEPGARVTVSVSGDRAICEPPDAIPPGPVEV